MLITNIVLILILLGFLGAGLKDGFVQTLGRLVGSILGIIAGRLWSAQLSVFLAPFMPAGWARLIAFVIIFLIATRLVGFAFKIVDGVYKVISFIPFLKSINSFLGALLGALEGFVLVGGAIWLIVTFKLIPSLLALLTASAVAMWILHAFQSILGILL